MPYSIKKQGKLFVTYNKDTGHAAGHHVTKAKANAQMRLLRGIEHGWKPTRK